MPGLKALMAMLLEKSLWSHRYSLLGVVVFLVFLVSTYLDKVCVKLIYMTVITHTVLLGF